ncbi:GerAB/ArcD/ProY family transporter [Gracilibacillus salitolerans]|uniref:GerAB/ArcD/ProY family transporter n=1 Tax=Gracilibacillus salitolerans TaxID=2663022 RepID=A0A5Q2TN90_9BACI|nr:endospore germination permease [Gracilibacillus salitolerans]QGH36439.1 GerAB/ArcD/ProY family transporter [Gracilibacillus salitolerans]
MEKIRISSIQALMLAISSITVTGHLLFIPVIINHAGRDSWLSVILAIFPAMLIGFVIALLAQRYPEHTLIEYSQIILGKWIGKIIAIIFLFYFFHEASLSLRGFSEFYNSAITPRTPLMIYLVAMLMLAVYTIRNRLEILARTNQTFLVLMIPIGIMASILTHKDKDYQNLLPILEDGFSPVMVGSFNIISLYSSFIVLGMVFPYVANKKKLKRFSILTMLILIIMFIGPITGVVAVFGEERAMGLYFPTFQTLRDIEIGALQRLDILGVVLWSLGSFSKISLFLYAIVVGMAQLFHIDDYTLLTIPTATLLAIFSLLTSDDLIGIYRFLMHIYPYFSTFIALVIPILLLMISQFKQIKRG